MLSSSRPACPTNGSPCASSSAPGRLADEQPLGPRIADTRHALLPAAAEPAGGAGVDVGREIAPLEARDARPRRSPRRCGRDRPPARSARTPDGREPELRQDVVARGHGTRNGEAGAASGDVQPADRTPHDQRVLAERALDERWIVARRGGRRLRNPRTRRARSPRRSTPAPRGRSARRRDAARRRRTAAAAPGRALRGARRARPKG